MKKIHWGAGLVTAFLVFAAGVVVMVMISMNREVDLVAEDYYQQELKHEQQIQRTRRATAFGDSLHVRMVGTSLLCTLPAVFSPDSTKGTVTFYRPANRKQDFVVPLLLTTGNTQSVDVKNLERGLWRVKVRWTYRQEDYFKEEAIIIQ
jgi:hypothetical protein